MTVDQRESEKMTPKHPILCQATATVLRTGRIRLKELSISPLNPRQGHEDSELSHSIDQNGMLSPILLRDTTEGLRVLAGSRRYHALLRLRGADGWLSKNECRLCPVMTDSEALRVAQAENRDRSDPSTQATADWIARLTQHVSTLTDSKLAQIIDMSETQISRYRKLSQVWDDLPQSWQRGLAAPQGDPERLTVAHFADVVSLLPRYGEPMDREARKLLNKAAAEHWSTRQLRRAIKGLGRPSSAPAASSNNPNANRQEATSPDGEEPLAGAPLATVGGADRNDEDHPRIAEQAPTKSQQSTPLADPETAPKGGGHCTQKPSNGVKSKRVDRLQDLRALDGAFAEFLAQTTDVRRRLCRSREESSGASAALETRIADKVARVYEVLPPGKAERS